jgi:hypothetical protein
MRAVQAQLSAPHDADADDHDIDVDYDHVDIDYDYVDDNVHHGAVHTALAYHVVDDHDNVAAGFEAVP